MAWQHLSRCGSIKKKNHVVSWVGQSREGFPWSFDLCSQGALGWMVVANDKAG